MSTYLLGVATLPAVALVGWLALLGLHAATTSWRRWRPTFIGDEHTRALHAATLATARRILVIRLPGSRLLAWRSNVHPGTDDAAARAYFGIMDALLEESERARERT